MAKVILREVPHGNFYMSDDERHRMARENGIDPRGNLINNKWVYRIDGEFVDCAVMRSRLAEQHDFDYFSVGHIP